MFQSIIAISHSDVYATLGEAARLIGLYPSIVALHALARIESVLIDFSYEDMSNLVQNQQQLYERLCSERQKELIRKGAEETTRLTGQLSGVFHRFQIAIATKLAFRNCSEGISSVQIPLYDLVDALLIINNHIGPDLSKKPTMYQLFSKNIQFTFRDEFEQSLGRWAILTKKVIEMSRSGEFATLDLEKRYEAKNKMGLESYLLIGYYIFHRLRELAKGLGKPGAEIDEKPDALFFSFEKLKGDCLISDDDFEDSLKEFCAEYSYFKQAIDAEVAANFYNNVPLLKAPLIRFEDQILCLSKHFLAMKISSGFYWVLIELYDFKNEPKGRRSVQKLFGLAFESYVMETLERIYGKGHCSPFIPIHDARVKRGRLKCEALIDYGDAIIVVECKSSLLPLTVLTSEEREAFDSWEKENIIYAARQIDDVIDQLKAGELVQHTGIMPERAKKVKYYPLIITLEYLPTSSPDYLEHLEQYLRSKGLLQGGDIERFNLMSISEFEATESPLVRGEVTLKQMLALKNAREESYYNETWLHFIARNWKDIRNRYLNDRFKAFIAEGFKRLFGHEPPAYTP